ncbi:pyridoxamine 5'-phosphate oxidase [Rhizobium sp. Root274]|uniref:pyridoxamine 5'-phosphate oxidase family protein n=1 Tax=unclassified Rhizobium TaxID=2613769 RepID=UPI0007129842|nr:MULTISPECIES: pyridoxamine 5'-phosphate oxidase family protein [unclassified Rhizobium]KQW31270.1 pyridoxamine 5'-phosphate oxidase [Rhizobium sp. Root1240]KRD32816.1 pyridoxamine 5'-phosphate oxidase [Rhizobium sp. Root274]
MSDGYQCHPEHVIGDETQLRALFEPTHDLALRKCQSRLGVHAQAFIRRSPFLCIGTQTPKGKADVSPRGDPPGFVEILDAQTIAIPDRPGNNRLDTLSNIIANPAVGLLFVIPGFDDTLRLNGRARLSTDPALLNRMPVNGKLPKLAIVVQIDEVFLHCAKAFRRSQLWDPAARQERSELPSLMKFILDDIDSAPKDADEMRKLDEGLEQDYQASMY